MAGIRTIKVRFTGDTKDLDRAARESERHMSGWAGGVSKVGAAAAALGVAAGAALFAFARSSVDAFVDAQESQTRLQDALSRFPSLADTNIARLQTLNKELATKTKFDDDALASGQAVLAQFGLTGKQLEDMTPLLADYAAKTGKDLPGAAEALGKSFLGNTRALKELGIDYTSTGDQAKDMAAITDLLREKVGGFAEEQGKAAAGQAAIMSNKFGELKETVGEKLLPALLALADVGMKVVDFISQNIDILGPLAAIIGAVVIAQWAWNVAMTANPIGLIIVAIAATIAIIAFLITKTTVFQDTWRIVWGSVKAAALAVWDWLKNLPGMIGDAFKSITNFISAPFRAAFNLVADAWNNTIGKLCWSVPDWVPFIGGKTISAPRLPRFHMGGIVPGPFGKEVPILARAGEVVLTADQARSSGGRVLRVEFDLGEDIKRVIEIQLDEFAGGLRRRVMAGARA